MVGKVCDGTDYQFEVLDNTKLIFAFESLRQILYADFADLRRERLETDRAIELWLQELAPEMLLARVHYSNPARGIEREHSLWFGLTHFFNHQTHHRGQVTTLLHQLGCDYGVLDFLAMYDLAKDSI